MRAEEINQLHTLKTEIAFEMQSDLTIMKHVESTIREYLEWRKKQENPRSAEVSLIVIANYLKQRIELTE